MASISSGDDFSLSLSGTVVYNGSNSYALSGSFTGTDYLGNQVFTASFDSIDVSLFSVSFAKTFQITGSLFNSGGILTDTTTSGNIESWSFVGETDEAHDIYDIGGDDTIGISGSHDYVSSYDTGALIALHFFVNHDTLDSLFSGNTGFGQGEMDVTIVPAPTALVLGMIGFGTVGWFRRRMS